MRNFWILVFYVLFLKVPSLWVFEDRYQLGSALTCALYQFLFCKNEAHFLTIPSNVFCRSLSLFLRSSSLHILQRLNYCRCVQILQSLQALADPILLQYCLSFQPYLYSEKEIDLKWKQTHFFSHRQRLISILSFVVNLMQCFWSFHCCWFSSFCWLLSIFKSFRCQIA